MSIKLLSFMVSLCVAAAAYAQLATTRAGALTRDTSFIAPDGTAYITGIIPVPVTVSPDAQKQIARQQTDIFHPTSLADRRAGHFRQAGSGRTEAGAVQSAFDEPAQIGSAGWCVPHPPDPPSLMGPRLK